MQELSSSEVLQVNGAGVLLEWWTDMKAIISDVPSMFDSVINSTVEVACRITGDC